jgi:hypothetical protein
VEAERFFFSETLNIEVDARRSSSKNDLNNITSLIDIMTSTGQETVEVYRGRDDQTAQNVTVQQLKALTLEMKLYGLSLYNKKWQKETEVKAADDLDALNSIEW